MNKLQYSFHDWLASVRWSYFCATDENPYRTIDEALAREAYDKGLQWSYYVSTLLTSQPSTGKPA